MASQVQSHLIVRERGTPWLPQYATSGVDNTLVLMQLDEEEPLELEARLNRRVKKYVRKEQLRSAVIACGVENDGKTLSSRYRIARKVLMRMKKSGSGTLKLILHPMSVGIEGTIEIARRLLAEMTHARLSVHYGENEVTF